MYGGEREREESAWSRGDIKDTQQVTTGGFLLRSLRGRADTSAMVRSSMRILQRSVLIDSPGEGEREATWKGGFLRRKVVETEICHVLIYPCAPRLVAVTPSFDAHPAPWTPLVALDLDVKVDPSMIVLLRVSADRSAAGRWEGAATIIPSRRLAWHPSLPKQASHVHPGAMHGL